MADIKQQTDKLHRYLLGVIRSVVENGKGCIGTCYRNKGIRFKEWLDTGGNHEDGYETSPTVIVRNNRFDTIGGYVPAHVYDLYINPADGKVCCCAGPDDCDYASYRLDELSLDSLQRIVRWLQQERFLPECNTVPDGMTPEFWDFIERHLPDYHDRYDVYRQGALQLFIDSQDERDLGLTRDEAREERDRLLPGIYTETISALAGRTPEQKELEAKLEEILSREEKCGRFAEILLNEVMTDTEPYHKVSRAIIDAYRRGDCDDMLTAICGWSMKSLIDKTQ